MVLAMAQMFEMLGNFGVGLSMSIPAMDSIFATGGRDLIFDSNFAASVALLAITTQNRIEFDPCWISFISVFTDGRWGVLEIK